MEVHIGGEALTVGRGLETFELDRVTEAREIQFSFSFKFVCFDLLLPPAGCCAASAVVTGCVCSKTCSACARSDEN